MSFPLGTRENGSANYIERGENNSKNSLTHPAVMPASPARIRSNPSIIDTADPARRAIGLVHPAAGPDRVWGGVEEGEERGGVGTRGLLLPRQLRDDGG